MLFKMDLDDYLEVHCPHCISFIKEKDYCNSCKQNYDKPIIMYNTIKMKSDRYLLKQYLREAKKFNKERYKLWNKIIIKIKIFKINVIKIKIFKIKETPSVLEGVRKQKT